MVAASGDVIFLSGKAAKGIAQRAQHPLIKEYTLNHNIKAPIILGYIP